MTATAPVKGLVALSVTVSGPGWVVAVVAVVPRCSCPLLVRA